MGRKPIGRKPLTKAEIQKRWRHKRKLAAERAERQARHAARVAAWGVAAAKASTELAGLGKRYSVIVADPGWHPSTWSEKGLTKHPSLKYTTTPTEAIAAIRVPAAPDAVLGLWAIIPMLPDALRVMQAWGFDYKTAYGWMKPGLGHGYWSTKDQLELLLIGTRGRLWVPPVRGKQPPQIQRIELPELLESAPVLTLPRCAHSAKPDVFYDELSRMFPGLTKLEMYARGSREGWDRWGDQA